MKSQLVSFHTGPAATVREVRHTLDPTDPPDWRATIGTWFIDAPGQSVAWRHYVLSAIHLRPIEGVKPAVIRALGMTHEFMLVALDPAHYPLAHDPMTWSYLRPFNLVEQLELRDDLVASKLLDFAAIGITQGHLWAEPPLSGQTEPWHSFLKHWGTQLSVGAPT